MSGGREDPLSTGNGRICLLKIIATQAEGLDILLPFLIKKGAELIIHLL